MMTFLRFRNRGDDDQHDRGQAIQPDRPAGVQKARLDPIENMDVLRRSIMADEDDPRQKAGKEQQQGRHPLCALVADDAPAEARDNRADKGGEQDDLFHWLSPSSR